MSKELLKILADSNEDIDNQKLVDYINGKLPAGEIHEIEKQMQNSELIADAVEGLSNFKNKEGIITLAEQLNLNLHKQLEKKKARRKKRKLKEQPWLYLTVILILILITIGFFVIKKHFDNEKRLPTLPDAKAIVVIII